MKNYRKSTAFILCAIICVFAVLCLVGCDNNDSPDDKGYIVLSFDLKWDGPSIDPIILNNKDEKTMPKDPLRAGYTFAGWYFDETYTVKFDPNTDALTGDTTLYAKWTKNEIEIPDKPIIEDPKGLIYKEETSDGNILYTVTGYEGTSSEVVVPARYNSHPVTKIADKAFENNEIITKVSFGLNITSVGKDVFRGCSALKEITVANGSYYYASKDGLLYNRQMTTLIAAPSATELTGVTFGKELSNIYEYALENCKFAVTFEKDSGYTEIEGYDFAGFKGTVSIGKSVTDIRQCAFKDATGEVKFAADCALTEIGMGAFDSYKGSTLIIPGTVKTIYGHAFNSCTATVDLSRMGITKIGQNSFAGYRGETLVVPIGVTSIEKNAFYQSTTDITFASGSTYSVVEEDSFSMFYGTVTFPFTLERVEKNAFWEARATVKFDCAQNDLVLASGYNTSFKGEFVYLKN